MLILEVNAEPSALAGCLRGICCLSPRRLGNGKRCGGDQPGQRQKEPLGSPAPGPVIPWVAPGWGGQSARDIANTTWFKSWMGICFCPHVLSGTQVDASGAGGGDVATGMPVKVLPKGRVPSAGVC